MKRPIAWTWVNQLKGRVTMLTITQAVTKNLNVDEIVRIAGGGPVQERTPHTVNKSIGVPA